MTDMTAEAVRAEVRTWLKENWDPNLGLVEWRNKLADSGWGAPHWPKEWYGRDLPAGLVPVVEEEFERARGHVKGSLVLGLEDPGGRMSRLGKSEIAHGEILSVSQTLARIEHVTLEDARRVAERVLSQPKTLTVLGPFAGGAFKEVMA
jgi:predicted Zn-dependent peptidase